jgi:thymidylate kinase
MNGRAVSVYTRAKALLKMKITVVSVAAISLAASLRSSELGILFAVASTIAFALYGTWRSRIKKSDSLNDLPNAVRVAFGVFGGYLLSLPSGFVVIVLGIFCISAGVLLNDEYQRRTLDSLRRGRRGGSIVLLGIDGSGKSTHTSKLVDWFAARGYFSAQVPFHRYLFVDALSRSGNSGGGEARRGSGNPLRPFLSLLDNLILHLQTSFGSGIEGRVVVYDRYIWSTYVKYAALLYPVTPIRVLYMLPRPKFAIILDIPVERSLRVIQTRPEHLRYQREVLEQEREEYLRIAREGRYPIIDSTADFETVQREIETKLSHVFPRSFGANQ